MELLFVHDGPSNIDKFYNLYGQTMTDEVWNRYLVIADKIKFATRVNIVKPNEVKFKKNNMENLEIIPCPNLSSLKGQILNKKRAQKILTQAIKETDYVVVRLPSLLGYLAFDIAVKEEKPCLVEVVTCPWDAYTNHSFKGKIAAPFAYSAMKRRVKQAEHVVYVTNKFLQQRYPSKGKNISASNVILTDFNDAIVDNRIEKIQKMNINSKTIIGTVANVNVRFKGQQYVIEALGKLKKDGITNYEYHLVGNGDQTYLRKKAKEFNVEDQVKFIGAMPHKKVFDWLETIDIYVQPSRQEGLPRALIEAMSRGLPAFGAKTAGIPELLNPDFIFTNTKNNINEICTILKKFDKETMLQQANRNFNESKKYDKSIIEDRREKFFESFKNSK